LTYGGGGVWNDFGGTASLINSTLSGNSSGLVGGGIANNGSLSVTNCTFSGNSANYWAPPESLEWFYSARLGPSGGSSIFNNMIDFSLTRTGPAGPSGSGYEALNACPLTITNSIFKNDNWSGTRDIMALFYVPAWAGRDDFAYVDSLGNDPTHVLSRYHINILNNTFGMAPDPLADNGGPTPTMALPAGSPAIDAASILFAPGTDQRGFARDAHPDIGAFEVEPAVRELTLTRSLAAVTVEAGSPATNTGTIDAPQPQLGVALTASLGTVTWDAAAGTWSWSYTSADGPGGPIPVTITATDASGLQATTTFTLTVNGAALTDTSTTANPSATEGASTGSLTVATFTDANPGDHHGDFSATIHWGDGSTSSGTVSYSNGTYSVQGGHTYAEEGNYAVTADINDAGGSSLTGIGRTTVAVADAPLADTTGTTALSAKEGASTGDQVVGSFSDADPNAVPGDYTATIYWGDGSSSAATSITQNGGTFSVHGSHTYAEEGTYHPYAVVSDDDGNPALTTGRSTLTTSQTLVTETVALVAPTAGVSGPSNGVPGQPRTFTFTATDPDPTDQAAGFVYHINWGDGTTQTIARTAGNGSGVALDHTYTAPGTYTVKVTATEDGGDTSATATTALTVQTVQMQGGTLAVGGTTGNDTIILSPADATGDLNVKVNGKSLGNFKPTDHILVYGQSGNDTIQLASKKINGTVYYVTVPAFLYGGGSGSDTLDARGSTANNVLTGGGGKNALYGGRGRDLLIAGLGASQLKAGSGDDILIGGRTDYDLTSGVLTYDQKLAALEAVMAEWGSADSYTTRVNDLLAGGGANGSSLLNSSTVHDNGQVDTLTGTTGSAVDWFLAGRTDVLQHKRTGEVKTAIA
jgi:hypothetical protein